MFAIARREEEGEDQERKETDKESPYYLIMFVAIEVCKCSFFLKLFVLYKHLWLCACPQEKWKQS